MRAGLFGMTGLRDPHLVQHADGRPFVRDGKAYLTWTCAGSRLLPQAHWAVFTLDLADPTRLEQVAQLYSRRDGLLLGDHAGQLVRDGDRWLVATSSWGDFDGTGVHVRHLATSDDLLSGVHLLETEPTDAADHRQLVGPRVHPHRRALAAGLRREPVPGPLRLPSRPGRDRVRVPVGRG